MSDTTNDNMKAAAVFVLGLIPNPITDIEKLVSTKTGGMFLPAIDARAILESGSFYSVRFPILACDLSGEKSIEEFRTGLHQRIDKTVDNFKKGWLERQRKLKVAEEPKEDTDAHGEQPEEPKTEKG